MNTTLEWGLLIPAASWKTFPAVRTGQTLFAIRDGVIEFPERDLTVWPWSGISQIGYLNIEPTLFRVNVDGVTSGDGVSCCCVVHFEVALKHDAASRNKAAHGHANLYNAFCLLTRDCAQLTFKRFNYSALRGGDEQPISDFRGRVDEMIDTSTPYSMRRCVISVASPVDGLDDQIDKAKSLAVGSEEIIQHLNHEARIEVKRRTLRQTADDAERSHQKSILAEQDASERAKRMRDAADELLREKEKREQEIALNSALTLKEIQHVAALRDASDGDPLFWFSFKHPDLYAKMRLSDNDTKREVANAIQRLMDANAEDRGKLQALTKVMNQTRFGLTQQRLELTEREQPSPPAAPKETD
jgi:hypothetical protein